MEEHAMKIVEPFAHIFRKFDVFNSVSIKMLKDLIGFDAFRIGLENTFGNFIYLGTKRELRN